MIPNFQFEIVNSGAQSLEGFLPTLLQRLQELKKNGRQPVKLTCFLDGSNIRQFQAISAQLADFLQAHLGDQMPPVLSVGQPPLGAGNWAVEITHIPEAVELHFKQHLGIRYTLLQENQNQWLLLGIAPETHSPVDFEQTVRHAFEIAAGILAAEGMDFRQVIRQWNYIEGITSSTSHQQGEFQFYQVFNDIRAAFYAGSHLTRDFPAATGIGCNGGSFVLELMALNGQDAIHTISLKSPIQKNAYDYSPTLLVGDAILPGGKQAPLFERAKLVKNQHAGLVFISGTAAIYGENSVEIPEAEEQTAITIDNIFELISAQNLQQHGVQNAVESLQAGYLRVYVKSPEHRLRIENVCKQRFPTTPLLLVHSDVCRPELLVEIEAVYHVHFQKP